MKFEITVKGTNTRSDSGTITLFTTVGKKRKVIRTFDDLPGGDALTADKIFFVYKTVVGEYHQRYKAKYSSRWIIATEGAIIEWKRIEPKKGGKDEIT